MNRLLANIGISEFLDLYQVYLQLGADKREFKNVDNNMLMKAIIINNELSIKIFELLNSLIKQNNLRKEREVMYNKLISEASETQIKDFTKKIMNKLKAYNPDMFQELQDDLYKGVYGCHFNEWLLKCATEHMENEDGTTGGHWTVEQTTSVAKDNDIKFINFNQYDWNYVMNMIYSDYYGSVSNDVSSYVKLAKKFIMDKDAPEGKAYHYYIAMKKY